MDVSILETPDCMCDEFVRSMPGARLCHMPVWTRMVEQAFGHKGYYLVARAEGRVCGVLPMMQVRSRLFGNRMISQAFSDYGGALAAEPAAQDALYTYATDLARRHRCGSIEFRNTAALPYDLHRRTDKISLCLPLAPDPQTVWKGLRHKTRNRVRKAETAGLAVISGGAELLDDFYRVWTIRMRELGTPCYPRRLFTRRSPRTAASSWPGLMTSRRPVCSPIRSRAGCRAAGGPPCATTMRSGRTTS
jgi:serine/alanine adding enzyme